MKRNIILITVIIFLIVSSSGLSVSKSPDKITFGCDNNQFKAETEPLINYYNNNTEYVPDIMKTFLYANTTEISIVNSSIKNYTVQTNSDLEITNIDTEKPENPDVLLYTNKSVVCDIMKSDKPIKNLQQSYKNDDIEIKGYGVINTTRIYVIDLVNNIAGYIV